MFIIISVWFFCPATPRGMYRCRGAHTLALLTFTLLAPGCGSNSENAGNDPDVIGSGGATSGGHSGASTSIASTGGVGTRGNATGGVQTDRTGTGGAHTGGTDTGGAHTGGTDTGAAWGLPPCLQTGAQQRHVFEGERNALAPQRPDGLRLLPTSIRRQRIVVPRPLTGGHKR